MDTTQISAPDDIGCFVKAVRFPVECLSDITLSKSKAKKYLGNRGAKPKIGEGSITISLTNKDKRKKILEFWDDCDNGIIPAALDINYFGKDKTLIISIKGDLSESHVGGGASEVTVDFRILSIQDMWDSNPPVITLIGSKNIDIVGGGSQYIDEGASAIDDVDGDISHKIVTGGDIVDTNKIGDYVITYNVMDSSYNKAQEVTRYVHVTSIADTEKPIITLKGVSPTTITVGSTYIDDGVTAHDNIDGNITSKVSINSSVDSNKIGNYTVKYNVSDAAGNKADEVIRVVQVQAQKDTQPPVITLKGKSTVSIIHGYQYIDEGATAQDNIDGDVTSSIQSTNTVDINTIGQYEVRYNVSDSSGNKATEVKRIVNVIEVSSGTKIIEGKTEDWIVPKGIRKLKVCAIGGGGSGASIDNDATSSIFGGVAGHVFSGIIDVNPLETLKITAGVGGKVPSKIGSHGNAGFSSRINRGATKLISCSGGVGGEYKTGKTSGSYSGEGQNGTRNCFGLFKDGTYKKYNGSSFMDSLYIYGGMAGGANGGNSKSSGDKGSGGGGGGNGGDGYIKIEWGKDINNS